MGRHGQNNPGQGIDQLALKSTLDGFASIAFAVSHADGNPDAPWPELLGLGTLAAAAGVSRLNVRPPCTSAKDVIVCGTPSSTTVKSSFVRLPSKF